MGGEVFMHGYKWCSDDFKEWKDAAREFGNVFRDAMAEHGCCDGPWSRHFGTDFNSGKSSIFSPRTNVYSAPDGSLVFEFMLPGFGETDISLSFAGDRMVLKATPSRTEADGSRYERKDFTVKEIGRREYSVPADRYDQSSVKAVFKNGILTVTVQALPGSGGSDGVKIDIEAEKG
jgi:HSP20 family molecular chaperone IbpA